MSVSQDFFSSHIPWNYITRFGEGVVVQKDGVLQKTFAYRAPDLDSSNAMEVSALAVRVNDFAKRLGEGWAFFFESQRFYTRDYPSSGFDFLAPYLIDREREAAFRAVGKHYESSYYLTIVYRPPSESVKKLVDMFIESGKETGGSGGLAKNVEFFVNESNSVAGLLGNDMYLVPLSNEETVAYLHSSVSLNRHPVYFPHTQIFLDRVLPDSELINSLTMKLGEFYIPVLGVNDFPDESYPAILEALNRAKIEYRWVTRYICLDKEEAKKEAQKKEKAHRASRKSFFQIFAESTSGNATQAVNHGAGVKESDSIEAGIEIENDEAALGYLTTAVLVWDKDLKLARDKADFVRILIQSAGFTCKEERFNAFETFKSMMPGNVYANCRVLPVMSYSMSHIVPLSSVWAGMRRNAHAEYVTGVGIPHLICSTSEGTPFFLNLNPSDVGHAAIWGPTGAGKSTLLNLLELQFFKYPESQVIVFDKGRSCRESCLSVGGLFYEPAGDNIAGTSFQPLRDLESDRDVLDAIDFIEACITVNGYEVTPPMRSAIKESIELLKERPLEARTLTSFIQYSNYIDPETRRPVLKEYLGDYLIDGGKLGKIFDAKTSSLSLDTRFLAIEMEALMEQREGCVVPALVYLFNLVEKKFDGRLTLLVLDEAWLFLKNPIFAEKIAEWLKVLRKKNVFVVFATQDVADVEKSPLKTTVIQQCLTKIYLADPSATTPGMYPVYSAFGLSDAEINLIASSTMKRDYFYTSPLGRRLFQLDLGPLTLSLIGSPDHALLDSLVAEYESGSPLCEVILQRKNAPYKDFLGEDSPRDKEPVKRKGKPPLTVSQKSSPEEKMAAVPAAGGEKSLPAPSPVTGPQAGELFRAVLAIRDKKNKGGDGRAAWSVAKQFGLSQSTVYQARKVLLSGKGELIDAMKKGEIPIKTAYKRLKDKEGEAERTL